MNPLFLGIDGGGSKTTLRVCDGKGALLAETVGESINYYALGMEKARENMRESIRALLDNLHIERFTSAFIGMSALAGRATAEDLTAFTEGVIPADFVEMDSDLFIALEAAQQDGPLCVVIAGTGSMAVARDANGEIRTAGGWGHTLGDEGSGYFLALEGIKAAIRGGEGSASETALTEAVLAQYEVPDCFALIDLFYDPPMEKKQIAAFAPQVCRLAQEGDSVAQRILARGAAELAATTAVLLRKLPRETPVFIWGGIFEHVAFMRELFGAALEKLLPNKKREIRLLPNPPVYGAVLAAMELGGRETL